MQLPLFQSASTGSGDHTDPVLTLFSNTLSAYIPGPAVYPVATWFAARRVKLRISRGRNTKSGDFRPPRNGSLPVISVNCTLNPYAFLITLVHEMAHFHIYDTCLKQGVLPRNKRIPPHGKEWKQQFRNSFQPFLTADIFPAVVLAALYDHLKNPRASSCTDSLLARVLLQFDRHSPGILMEALPAGCLFTAQGGRLFRKEAKLRKRYRCLRLNDGKIFLFSPLARVFRVDQQK